jgi:membrane fusion protein, multidrug efflux system
MKMSQLLSIRSMKFSSFVVCITLLSACGGKMSLPDDNEFAVRTLMATDAQLSNAYPATIRGKQDIEIRPKIAGFITRVCVNEGSAVRKGQLLFTIDDVQYREAVKEAAASIGMAKAQLATARLTYQNKKQLQKQNVIGTYDMQTAANSVMSARASLEQAKASLITARQNLAFCRVTSPCSGVVGSLPYRVGSLVSSTSAQALTTVSNIGDMYVYFSMTEKQLLSMTRESGNANAALKSFPAVNLKLADGTVYSQTGRISAISGVIDQTTGSVSIRADFKNPEHLLKSGGSGSIVIPYIAQNAILIPQDATNEVQDKKYVYVVDSNNKVKNTLITIADVDDGQNYIVTGGLKSGDRIVVEGVGSLQDGAKIKPISEARAAEKIKEAEKKSEAQGNIKSLMKMMKK